MRQSLRFQSVFVEICIRDCSSGQLRLSGFALISELAIDKTNINGQSMKVHKMLIRLQQSFIKMSTNIFDFYTLTCLLGLLRQYCESCFCRRSGHAPAKYVLNLLHVFVFR